MENKFHLIANEIKNNKLTNKEIYILRQKNLKEVITSLNKKNIIN